MSNTNTTQETVHGLSVPAIDFIGAVVNYSSHLLAQSPDVFSDFVECVSKFCNDHPMQIGKKEVSYGSEGEN